MVEKILNNTTPYGKNRASHEGSLHSSTLKPAEHQPTQRNWTVLLVGVSCVSSRRLVCGVSKTSFGSSALACLVVFLSSNKFGFIYSLSIF